MIFLTALQGQVHHLFHNRIGQDHGFLRVALEGTRSGRDAYGAEVRVQTSQGTLTKIKAGGAGFVSQSDPRLLFGLGDDPSAESLHVRWPSGLEARFDGVPSGSSVLVREGQPGLEFLDEDRFSLPDPLAADAVVYQALQPQKGQPFPPIALLDGDGAAVDFDTYRQPGRRYVVNLWATWCGPCRQEMPELEKLAESLRAAGVDVIGISVDTGAGRQQVPSFLSRMGITYPVFTTPDSSIEQLFAGERIFVPVTFVVDGDGRIADLFSGWSRESEARIRKLLQ